MTMLNNREIIFIWKFHVAMTKEVKNIFICHCYVTFTIEEAYRSNSSQFLKHSLSFIVKNCSLLLATSVLSPPPKSNDTTSSLDNLSCTKYVDFGYYQDILDVCGGPKMTSTTWLLNLKCSRETSFAGSKISPSENQISTTSCS